MNNRVYAEGEVGNNEFGPESTHFTTLPVVHSDSPRERCHTSNESIGQRNVVFSPIDRGLNINKGLRLGQDSEDYRPLSAAISHRLINSTTGRIVHEKTISNLREYDECKVAVP